METVMADPILTPAAAYAVQQFAVPVVAKLISHLLVDDKSLSGQLLGTLIDKGAELGKDQLAIRLKAEPRRLIEAHEHLFVRYTGWVIGQLIMQVVQQDVFEKERKELVALAADCPDRWKTFVLKGTAHLSENQRNEFVSHLADALATRQAVPSFQDIPFKAFFAWNTPLKRDLPDRLDAHLKKNLGNALQSLLVDGDANATKAWKQIIQTGIVDLREQLLELKLIGIETLEGVRQLRDHLMPQPVDPVAAIDAYAEKLIRVLSPVPLGEIASQGKTITLGVQQVFTPLMIRRVERDDIEHLAHAKEAIDYAGREQASPDPERLREKNERLSAILRRSPPVEAVSYLDRHRFPHHLILGEPGGGKTLLARHIALQWSVNWQANPQRRQKGQIFNFHCPLYLYAELKHYASRRESHVTTCLRDYLTGSHYPFGPIPAAVFDDAVFEGGLFIILDGLDEVLCSGTRQDIIAELTAFRNVQCGLILTSRIADFKPDTFHSPNDWQFHRIDPLTPEEQRVFIRRYHEAFFPDPEERQHKVDRLQHKLRDFHRLAELAGTPLLLTLLCLVNRDPALPETRTELYQQAAELLLHNWDFFHFQERDIQSHLQLCPLTKTEKHALMRRLAWLIMMGKPGRHANDEGVPLDRQHLSANLFPTAIVEEAVRGALRELGRENPENYVALIPRLLVDRNSVLCSPSSTTHSFIHRTFLEFYAAWAWQEEELKWDYGDGDWQGQLWPAGMKPTERFDHLFLATSTIVNGDDEEPRAHWEDSVWRVILVLHCGLVKSSYAEKLILHLLFLVDELNGTAAEAIPEFDEDGEFIHPKGRRIRALHRRVRAEHALMLAAECFSETRERGRLADLALNLLERLKVLANSGYGSAYPHPQLNLQRRQHHLQAIHYIAQLAPETMSAAQWIENFSMMEYITPELLDACLVELTALWLAPERLKQHLHRLLVSPDTSEWCHNTLFRHIARHWQQSGLDEAFRLFERPAALSRLELTDCPGLVSLEGLKTFTGLETLDLRRCIALRAPGLLSALQDCHALDTLYLSGCIHLPHDAGLGKVKNLKTLFLDECISLQSGSLLPELVACTQLEELNLGGCQGLTHLDRIGELAKLRTLEISHCIGLKGPRVLDALDGCEALAVLDLSNCSGLTSLHGLGHLPMLERLCVVGCSGLQGPDVLTDISGCQRLSELDLAECAGITGIGGVENLPSLERLDLRACTGLHSISELDRLLECDRLDILGLVGCTGLCSEEVRVWKQKFDARPEREGRELIVFYPDHS